MTIFLVLGAALVITALVLITAAMGTTASGRAVGGVDRSVALIEALSGAPRELTKDLDEVLTALGPEMELQKQRMIDNAARIYATKLSEAELQDIATFFRSPAGKRYVETQPQVLDEMVQAMQTWTQDVSEYVMVRVRAEMTKRGHQMQ